MRMDKASESPLPKSKESRRSGGRAARRAKRQAGPIERPVRAGMAGGQYKPLSDADLQQIHRAAVEILATIGIGDVTPQAEEIALMHGCSMSAHGRLLIPASVIEDVIAGACREYVIHSRSAEHADLQVGGNRVHYATSGEAVSIYEVASKSYRPSTLKDLYDLARMVEVLPNIHQFGQMVVPTELEIAFEHDLNVAYAISAGTQKPAEMTFTDVKNIAPAISLFDRVLGGDGRFKEKPYLSFGGCPIVSPLRFGADNLDVLIETSRLGLINDIAIAPQAGATAPAHLAGALAQVTAEGLACLAMVNFVRPGCPMSFAIWPFVSDLRTGSFSGGSGEEALLMAAAAQIGRFYDLPTTVAASMTDSKLPDAQAGYEKGISSVMAGLAGANRVLESAGMLGSLMGCSFEALVIDNDMLGMAQRALRGIEVSDETLNLEAIKDVVLGPGHFLGHPSTLDVMESEYLYPDIADRTATGTWEKFGALDMLERASYRVNEILSEQPPIHIDKHADAMIRDQFPTKLKVGEFAS